MALIPSFTAAQSPTAPGTIVLVDTSTGSDVSIVARRIYITDSAGNYIVTSGTTTNYMVWPLANSTITLTNIISSDMALSIRVDWVDSGGTAVETDTQQFCFDLFSKQFLYYLVQLQGLTPTIPADTNYNQNLAIVWANVLGAQNAIALASDLAASQNCLNRVQYYIQNQNLFF